MGIAPAAPVESHAEHRAATENVRQDYRNRLEARRAQIIALAHHHGWSFTLHHTDRPAQEALLALYGAMTVPRMQW